MTQYVCTGCKKPKNREELTVKRVQFATMGKGYTAKKNRTVAWLCPECLNEDPAWRQPATVGAPQHAPPQKVAE